MLTKETLYRAMRQQGAYGDSGPHSIIGPPPMFEQRRYATQEPFGPGTVFRHYNERIGAHFLAITPYVGEEIKL